MRSLYDFILLFPTNISTPDRFQFFKYLLQGRLRALSCLVFAVFLSCFALDSAHAQATDSSSLLLTMPAIVAGSKAPSDCSRIAGQWGGTWAETSCDGHGYAGSWTGIVYDDCIFYGTDNWDFLQGEIDPSTLVMTGTGISRDGCGTVSATATFTVNGTVTGSYSYSLFGGGTFEGALTP